MSALRIVLLANMLNLPKVTPLRFRMEIAVFPDLVVMLMSTIMGDQEFFCLIKAWSLKVIT